MYLRRMLLAVLSVGVLNAQIFINEIDYDQPGTDSGEFFELAGLAGTYNNVVVDLLNGSNGTSYNTINLGNITLSDESDGYGFYVVGASNALNVDFTPAGTFSIQNGSPDGIQLSVNGSIVDGVAYEGTMNDLAGNLMESTDDGTNFYPETGVDTSFSRLGADASPWVVTHNSPGTINVGQTFDPNANYAPIANAGPNQTVEIDDVVTLDGSGSTDSDGTIVAYAWTQTAGPGVTLSATNQAVVTFTVPNVTETTTFSFELTVTDDTDSTDTDAVDVTVYVVTNMTIAQARQQSMGALVSISGVVTSINWQSSATEYNVQDETAAIALYYASSMIDLNMGDQVQITGAIGEYSGKLEIIPTSEANVAVTATGVTLPDPVLLTIAQLNANGESYESQLIRINQVSNDGSGNAWPATGVNANINITDDGSDVAVMRIDKETDIDGTTEPIWPADIIGVATEFSGTYQIMPSLMSDILVETSAPSFENLTVSPGWITNQDEIELTVDMIPPDAETTVQSANILYGTDGTFLNSAEMWLDQGNTWMGIVPAQAGNSKLQFKFQTTDNNSLVSTSSAFTQMIASTTTSTIAAVQANPVPGAVVTIQGVVTIGSGLLQSGVTNAYVQDESGRGINLFNYSDVGLVRGDNISVVGEISLYGTRVEVAYFNYRLNSTANELPAPIMLSPGQANSPDYEGTWIQFSGTIVDQYTAGGGTTYFIGAGTDTTTVRIWATTGIELTSMVNGTTWSCTGVGSEYNSTYQLLVGYAEDMDLLNALEDTPPLMPTEFSLGEPYPNPFNPSTSINWELPMVSKYTLEIYDLAGHLVQTLESGSAPAGKYHTIWQAQGVASGIYFVRLSTPSFTQTRKVMLLK